MILKIEQNDDFAVWNRKKKKKGMWNQMLSAAVKCRCLTC